MNKTLTLGKRVVAVATAAATILWALGAASFAVPQTAHAASPGDLVRGTSLSTLYYYGYDGSRYTFTNEKTYNTWYTDFSGVQTLSDSAIADITLGGNVVYRPGSRWIKIESNPKTYAVSTGGTIHWIESETVATDLAGSNWSANIDDVADVFFVDYSTGASLMTATAFDGMLYMSGTDYMVALNNEARKITSAGLTANNLQTGFFLTGTGIDTSALSSGADITSELCELTDAAQTGCVTVSGGDVTLSVSSATPAGATLPQGANSVEVLALNVKGGSEATSLDSLALTMSGIGATTNITNAYLYEGSTRLTEARSVNASTRMVSFNNLGLSLDANQTRTLTLRIEVGTSLSSAGDEIKFEVTSVNDVTASGNVAGGFPLVGNSFSLANTNAGTLTITRSGTIVNPTLGSVDAKIGEFKITAASEDANMDSVTLKIDNASDHSNFKLWKDGSQVSVGEYLGGKLVKFDLATAGVTILDGQNDIFTVTADIGGSAGDKVKVYVDKAVDVLATGSNFGFGMTAYIGATSLTADSGTYSGVDAGIVAGTCNETADECSYSVVEGGDVTFAFVGPSAGDVPTNSQDQTLFEFNLTAQNAITVKDMPITVFGDDNGNADAFDGHTDGWVNTSTPGTDVADLDGLINNANSTTEANLKDIKIINRDTGAVLLGPLELSTAGSDVSQVIAFTDDFSMTAGEVLNLAVVADIDNNVADATEFGVRLDISGFVAEDQNGDTVSTSATPNSVVPSTALNGFNMTATASTLSVQLASAPASTTVVQGAQGVDFLGLSLTAGDGSDILVSSMTVTGYADDTNTASMTVGGAPTFEIEDYILSCSLYDGATLVDGPKGIATNGDIVFDTMNYTVAASASKTLNLNCNLGNPSDTDLDVVAFDVDVVADITARDVEGNDPTVSLVSLPSSTGINNTSTVGVFDASVGHTINPSGTLTVAKGNNMPSADFLMTGSLKNHVATYQFTASNEGFDVNTLTFSEEQATDDTVGLVDKNAYANNIAQVTVDYPKADGTTGTKSVSMVGNTAKFSGLDMRVPADGNVDVKVYVDVTATDRNTGGSATSNEKIRMAISSATGGFEAVGMNSGVTKTTVTAIGANPFATDGIPTFVVRETKPTVTLSSATPTGATKIPGDQEMFRFNIGANSNDSVVLHEVMFKVSTSNNTALSTWNTCDSGKLEAGDFDLYRVETNGTLTQIDNTGTWTLLDADGAACIAGGATKVDYALLTLGTPEVISAGGVDAYALYVDSTGASAVNDDSMQVSIEADLMPVSVPGTYRANAAGAVVTGGAQGTTATTINIDIAFTDVSVGDILAIGTERLLVTEYTGGTSFTAVRGYMDTVPVDVGNTGLVAITRLPSTFVWEDDGVVDSTSSALSATEYWGSYLVDSLPVTGNAIGF